MTLEERVERMESTTHVVFPDDKSIHVIEGVEIFGNDVYIETDTGFLFGDLDVFTVHEMVEVEQKIEDLLK
jgi:hypothetical protein